MAQPELTPRLVETEPEEDILTASPDAAPVALARGKASGNETKFSKLSLIVIALLVLSLCWTAFSLRSEMIKSAGLEADVRALEGELSAANATVSAHVERLDRVRDDVSALLSSVGALSALVSLDVVPAETTTQVPQAPVSVNESDAALDD
jgi:hypothetical protein